MFNCHIFNFGKVGAASREESKKVQCSSANVVNVKHEPPRPAETPSVVSIPAPACSRRLSVSTALEPGGREGQAMFPSHRQRLQKHVQPRKSEEEESS